MFYLQAEDMVQVGPDGQTQNWTAAKYTNGNKAKEAAEYFNRVYDNVFLFSVWEEKEEDVVPVDPSYDYLQNVFDDYKKRLFEGTEGD